MELEAKRVRLPPLSAIEPHEKIRSIWPRSPMGRREWLKFMGRVLSGSDPTPETESPKYGPVAPVTVLQRFERPCRLTMTVNSIQDRTPEFRAVVAQFQKRNAQAKGPKQSLLTEAQKRAASPNGQVKKGSRSEFARKAAEIGRAITGTMEKLERLAQRAYSAMGLEERYHD